MEDKNKHLYKYGSNKIKELNIDLWNNINNILLDIPFKEKFYLLENSLVDTPKCECGNSVKFIDMVTGYREFCSRRCMYDSPKLKEKRKNSCIDKYGVDNPSKSKEVRDKVVKTNLDKFGHEWATKSDDVKIKMKEHFTEKYGVDNPSKVKEFRDKAQETMLDRFGVKHAMHNEAIKDKVKKTNMDKYGVDNPSKVKEVRDKAQETMLDRFGVKHAMQNESIKDKVKKTNMDKYGVDSPLKLDDIREKIKKTNMDKYGVDNPLKLDEIREKIKKTHMDKYGVDNPFKSDIIIEKIKNTNMERYGETHISKNVDYREKYKITKHPNYISYIDNGISLFSCDKNEEHNFEISVDNFIHREKSNNPLCTICNPIGDLKSIKENELYLYIKSIYDGEVIQSYRDQFEIDIYLPDLAIGFEFNGLYWHSDSKKDKNYHLDKTNYFKDRDIRIIHVWEDDWTFNRDIIKSQINNWLGLTGNKIWARKCEILLINDTKIIKSFLNENHIQGYVNSVLCLGLYYDNELVSLMAFDHYEGRKKMDENNWNLSRFCNKLNINVVGGASKLLNYFIKEYNPNRIISYADRCWSDGGLYYTLGFKNIGHSRVDYKYIVNEKRVHKSRFKKSNLKIENMTETEYIKMNNISRIWDCGKLKFEMLF